jgi:hypothetical protein
MSLPPPPPITRVPANIHVDAAAFEERLIDRLSSSKHESASSTSRLSSIRR